MGKRQYCAEKAGMTAIYKRGKEGNPSGIVI